MRCSHREFRRLKIRDGARTVVEQTARISASKVGETKSPAKGRVIPEGHGGPATRDGSVYDTYEVYTTHESMFCGSEPQLRLN
jgi:hypothetical protein